MTDHEIWLNAFNRTFEACIANNPIATIAVDGVLTANPENVTIAAQYADLALAESKKRYPEQNKPAEKSGPRAHIEAEFRKAFNGRARYVQLETGGFNIWDEKKDHSFYFLSWDRNNYRFNVRDCKVEIWRVSFSDVKPMYDLTYRCLEYAIEAQTEIKMAIAHFDALERYDGGSNGNA